MRKASTLQTAVAGFNVAGISRFSARYRFDAAFALPSGEKHAEGSLSPHRIGVRIRAKPHLGSDQAGKTEYDQHWRSCDGETRSIDPRRHPSHPTPRREVGSI